ncbi:MULTISPECIES: helix-turn-helix domain-containing protein [Clostridium]|uniref:DNA-binding protein n=1 Tax=Clostridium sporogenes TaxID=1509 RepID=A0A7X5P9I2_CLOSG|nr:helix-turn-helix transcriptional regulator [Clostridium sporogenes]AJD29683.1 helix-turn-helix family protein [Clostridium botulinum Prevot_594]AKC63098.1 DNA-binding protein [Clostridium sporogenes]AKJ90314.1 membrane protein [Clostridium sporogenes]KCZ67785.1 DNA-binding protein [Clostridium sporogenes]KRU37025.1 transcriptional regulator [Clostridium sporogenes]
MDISKQIKKYRLDSKLSQEDLAEKVFVTRQTISNWENGKNYPDINSLVLLSTLFGVSLDILVKGDLEEMKEEIKTEDIKKFNHDGMIFTVLLMATGVLVVPLFLYLDFIGIAIWLVLFGITMYYARCIEKQKKTHDVQTYREIIAFTEGKKLDQIEKMCEVAKRPYQKVISVICSGLIAIVVTIGMYFLFRLIEYIKLLLV